MQKYIDTIVFTTYILHKLNKVIEIRQIVCCVYCSVDTEEYMLKGLRILEKLTKIPPISF